MTQRALDHLCDLRVAHLIESDGPGGAERMVAAMATEQQAAGCDVVVVLPAHGEGWLGEQLAGTGVTIECVDLNGLGSVASVRHLERLLRRREIAVAHSHEFTMGVYGAYASWRTGASHVITMHGGRYYAQRWRRRLALRVGVAMGGALVAVSTPLAKDLSRDLFIRRSRILTIPNGVRFDRAEGSSLRGELGLAPGDRLVLAVGNLYPVKGHEYLVQALAALASRFPGLHVAIAGRGDQEGALRGHAQALGVGGRLHLLGLQSDIPNLLAAADVFVLPSLSEGLPLALLEAMASACAIVATAVGEVPAVLDGGRAGLLVSPADPVALAAAVARLLGDQGESARLGAAAAARAETEYGHRRMLERYENLYAALITRS